VARSGFKIRNVVREFKDEKGIPRLELSCGHIKTDPMLWYGNEVAKQIRVLGLKLGGLTRTVRCYECRRPA
jgi:hypothetical protein